jgi:hypothetical protein
MLHVEAKKSSPLQAAASLSHRDLPKGEMLFAWGKAKKSHSGWPEWLSKAKKHGQRAGYRGRRAAEALGSVTLKSPQSGGSSRRAPRLFSVIVPENNQRKRFKNRFRS